MNQLKDLIENMTEFRILIVDDKTNMRRTIRNMLRALGFSQFTEADNGLTALNRMKSEDFDFVICDWNMPKMNGVEFLRAVRTDEQNDDLPFLMITGELEARVVTESIEANVDGYILKPFELQTLSGKMADILIKKQELSEFDAQILLAEHYNEVGSFYQAHLELDKASQINRQNPKIHFQRGLTFEAEGRLDKAVQSYQTSRKLGNKFIKSREKLAEYYEKKGDSDSLLILLEEMIAISPNNADRQTKYGQVLLTHDRIDEAKKAFKRALDLDPGAQDRRNQISNAFLAKDMDKEAETVLKSLVEINPQNLATYNRLGMVLRKQKKFMEAIAYYRKALTIAPDEENLHYNMAKALIGAHDSARAQTHLNKAIEVKPDFKEAHELLRKIKK